MTCFTCDYFDGKRCTNRDSDHYGARVMPTDSCLTTNQIPRMATTLTKKRKRVRLTADEMVAVVNEILSRGHDVEIRRGRGNTYIIIEVVKTTYRAGGQ